MEKVKQISLGAGLERKQKGNRKEIEMKERKQKVKQISPRAGLERKQTGNRNERNEGKEAGKGEQRKWKK